VTAANCAHWGTHGAAGLLVVDRCLALLQLRAQGVHEGGTWGLPGGARLKDEPATDAALREASEETGLDPQSVAIVATYTHTCACGWSYTTFVANLTGPRPELRGNWETSELRWVPVILADTLPLHPGLKAAWPALRDIMLMAPRTRPNITRLGAQLWTGGDRGGTSMATWLAQLEGLGITHVIDCRPHRQADRAYARAHAPHIGYFLNPQPDEGQQMPDRWFGDGVDFALAAMRDPAARVLVHCELGINRGPSLALAVLLATGMTPKQARSTIKSARPVAWIAYADQAARWWASVVAPEPIFYHGGRPGMHVGDMLLPPSVTGVATLLDGVANTQIDELIAMNDASPYGSEGMRQTMVETMGGMRQAAHDRESHRVYATTDFTYARAIAVHHGGGAVYRVQPLGNVEHTTTSAGQETACDSARILEVVKRRVTMESVIADEFDRLSAENAQREAMT
jgi:8-oxo-dGTP pyrophosphatase MutT (NUDIX family)